MNGENIPSLVDQLLGDLVPEGDDSDIHVGLQRGQDFKSISDDADMGLLDELFPHGEHNSANVAGMVVAAEDWNQNGARPFTREDSVMNDVLKQGSGLPRMASADVQMRISALLHLGKSPRHITAYLEKLAEQQVFDRQESADFLKDQSGLQGLAYIEPNHFNQKSCIASLRHIKQNGALKAASVKRIAACDDCTSCKESDDDSCKCATYGLPIVANAKDLGRVVAKLTGGTSKRSSLVERHNGGTTSSTPGHAVARVSREIQPTKTVIAGNGAITKFDSAAFRQANSEVTPRHIQASLDEGNTLAKVYASTKLKVGSGRAKTVVTAYLNGLKKSGARVNLAAMGCDLLKRRLTASETILGCSKCATCGGRQGMHCGITGGTLITYPGMEKSTGKRASMVNNNAPDGNATMDSLELHTPELDVPIGADRGFEDPEF